MSRDAVNLIPIPTRGRADEFTHCARVIDKDRFRLHPERIPHRWNIFLAVHGATPLGFRHHVHVEGIECNTYLHYILIRRSYSMEHSLSHTAIRFTGVSG